MKKSTTTILGALALGTSLSLVACNAPAEDGATTPTGDATGGAGSAAIEQVDEIRNLLPEEVLSAGTLAIGAREDAPPASVKDPAGGLEGYEVEIVDYLSTILGIEFEYQHNSAASLLPGLQADRFSAAFGSFGTTEERQEVAELLAYLQAPFGFVGRAADADEYELTGGSSLCGHSLAVSNGTSTGPIAEQYSEDCVAAGEEPIDIQVYANTNENLLAVRSERADAYFGPYLAGLAAVEADPTLALLGQDEHTEPASIGLSFLIGSELIPAFEAAAEYLLTEKRDLYVAAFEKWGLDPALFALDRPILNPEW
jgi:polar amino acid transport system substrate-binding protein